MILHPYFTGEENQVPRVRKTCPRSLSGSRVVRPKGSISGFRAQAVTPTCSDGVSCAESPRKVALSSLGSCGWDWAIRGGAKRKRHIGAIGRKQVWLWQVLDTMEIKTLPGRS